MRCGLYGKLIAKRDFIAVNLPPGFLARWEPWLQGSLASAKIALGNAWKETFFTAPLWRFWLGRDVVGQAMLGALMPSTDGVGRQFPLCLIAPAEAGATFASLAHQAQSAWFDAAEDLLLSTLDETQSFEETVARLEALPKPDIAPGFALPPGAERLGRALLATANPADGPETPLAMLREIRASRWAETQSIWWTIGGDNFPPFAFQCDGLPEPDAVLRMLAASPDAVPPRRSPLVPAVDAPAAADMDGAASEAADARAALAAEAKTAGENAQPAGAARAGIAGDGPATPHQES